MNDREVPKVKMAGGAAEELMRSMSELLDHAANVASLAEELVERLCGPTPHQPTPEQPKLSNSSAAMSVFHEKALEIHSRLDRIEKLVTRL